MLTMDWRGGTDYSLLARAIEIQKLTKEEVVFEFNGVKFKVDEDTKDDYLALREMQIAVKFDRKDMVYL